jgi:Lar family restriction alleviation protein
MELEVKPCPFCGCHDVAVIEGDTFRWRLARCNACGAQAGDVRIQTAGSGDPKEWEAKAHKAALAEWNKRAVSASESHT